MAASKPQSLEAWAAPEPWSLEALAASKLQISEVAQGGGNAPMTNPNHHRHRLHSSNPTVLRSPS